MWTSQPKTTRRTYSPILSLAFLPDLYSQCAAACRLVALSYTLVCRVDPFSDDSPIKALGIAHFPPDVFFVLRVMQLLRGLAGGLGVEFSAAEQWTPYAKKALRRAGRSY